MQWMSSKGLGLHVVLCPRAQQPIPTPRIRVRQKPTLRLLENETAVRSIAHRIACASAVADAEQAMPDPQSRICYPIADQQSQLAAKQQVAKQKHTQLGVAAVVPNVSAVAEACTTCQHE